MAYFSIFDELERIRGDFDRLLGNNPAPFSRFANFLPERSARSYPLLNVADTADEIRVEALAPGVNPEALQISVTGSQLTISGEKNALPASVKPEAFHRKERATARFVRTLSLNSPVDADKVAAEYRDGILRITLPKREEAKPRRINVQVN